MNRKVSSRNNKVKNFGGSINSKQEKSGYKNGHVHAPHKEDK